MLNVIVFEFVFAERDVLVVAQSGSRGSTEVVDFLGTTGERSFTFISQIILFYQTETALHVLSRSRVGFLT